MPKFNYIDKNQPKKAITLVVNYKTYEEIKEKANKWTNGNVQSWVKYAALMHDPLRPEATEVFRGLGVFNLD